MARAGITARKDRKERRNKMTNAEIIYRESIRLAKEGIIETTGRMLTLEKDDGETVQVPEPVAIHTYERWREMGYQVQKGEKAIARIRIWKKAKSIKQEDGTVIEGPMFLKDACFFQASQVRKAGL